LQLRFHSCPSYKHGIMPLTSNEIEAANRAEATVLLIRGGYRVYRPEADVFGEDLIVRTSDGDLLPVQIKVPGSGRRYTRSTLVLP
jgi:hypothetical protein